eukprot:TRINITY_DN17993_c0_g1_i1.p1 TRINITY_DN17993_c0_g1~~TRINITY_DN17993_c0_g1_i1.p1  ORF type:complete len:363 (-),score=84.39 TRINITY_DN17993_c0_g1_i1:212-1300(-)
MALSDVVLIAKADPVTATTYFDIARDDPPPPTPRERLLPTTPPQLSELMEPWWAKAVAAGALLDVAVVARKMLPALRGRAAALQAAAAEPSKAKKEPAPEKPRTPWVEKREEQPEAAVAGKAVVGPATLREVAIAFGPILFRKDRKSVTIATVSPKALELQTQVSSPATVQPDTVTPHQLRTESLDSVATTLDEDDDINDTPPSHRRMRRAVTEAAPRRTLRDDDLNPTAFAHMEKHYAAMPPMVGPQGWPAPQSVPLRHVEPVSQPEEEDDDPFALFYGGKHQQGRMVTAPAEIGGARARAAQEGQRLLASWLSSLQAVDGEHAASSPKPTPVWSDSHRELHQILDMRRGLLSGQPVTYIQ